MNALAYTPPTQAEFDEARAMIRGEHATRADLLLACNVLCQSAQADDRTTAREVRNVLWSDHASELLPDDRAMADRLHERDRAAAMVYVDRQVRRIGWFAAAYVLAMIVTRVCLGAV